jgi:hypothetical protein
MAGGSDFDPFEDQCLDLARYGTSGGQPGRMSMIMAELSPQFGADFLNSSICLGSALDAPKFNWDLTKSRLNGALCLCEMLLGTYPGRGIERGDLVELLWALCE